MVRTFVRTRLTRDENSARTRRRLLRAARDVFLERGFHGTSLEAVAEEAGFSKGAVYSRFESKADLFLALLYELNGERIETLRQYMSPARSAEDVETALKGWWADQMLANPSFQVAVTEYWSWAARDETVRQRISQEHEQMLASLAEVVDETVDRLGVVLPCRSLDMVRVVGGLTRGLASERQLNPELVDERVIRWAMDSLVPGQTDRATA